LRRQLLAFEQRQNAYQHYICRTDKQNHYRQAHSDLPFIILYILAHGSQWDCQCVEDILNTEVNIS
jgi:hypothetical protein